MRMVRLLAAVVPIKMTAAVLLAVWQRYVEALLHLRLDNTVTERILAKALTLELRHFEDTEVYDPLARARTGASGRPYQFFAGLPATVSAGGSTMVNGGSSCAPCSRWPEPSPWGLPCCSSYRTRRAAARRGNSWRTSPR
ncbi:hypothetical protein ACIBQX_36915 [Nonomuraea sp. NPDC049714]|uniref:hypothetical protein n=1 Tax=Nonomuraea sp. NPDC049714 TaxID=3364357 RepID=UPI0037AC6ECC